LCHNCIQWAK